MRRALACYGAVMIRRRALTLLAAVALCPGCEGCDSPRREAGLLDGEPPVDRAGEARLVDGVPVDRWLAGSEGEPRFDLKPPGADSTCFDPCPSPKGGVTWQCHRRFMYGTNWAWLDFGGDFGGVSSWGMPGVAKDSAAYAKAMAAMKAGGVNVIRWWMFPRFFTDSISFGSDDAPSGIGGSLVADIHKALEIAEQQGVFIMLTLFSFDSFAPTEMESGIYVRGLQPMIVDPARRQKLLQNLIVPVAKAVEASTHKKRMIAWDIINEPEWAMTGPDLYGSSPFTPQSGLQSVTHAQMETFLKETASALHQHSSALVTVGGSAIKWPRAWSQVNLDFYQLHYYDWVYEWFPYEKVTLASVGLTGKPVVMGEFPIQGLSAISSKGLPAVPAAQFAADLWEAGYAGALAWAYNDPSFPWSTTALAGFANQHACETAY
jgi:hypothetical protein